MILSELIILCVITSTLARLCEDIVCSNVIDYVCGSAISRDGIEIVMKYHNICHMRRTACKLASFLKIYEVPKKYCNIEEKDRFHSRRVTDHSIVGAYQYCNHTCPTHCTDNYDPACAKIYKRHSSYAFTMKPMINHCHIDLLSCSSGLNISIRALDNCYKNPRGLMFMTQLAGLKSLNLLGGD